MRQGVTSEQRRTSLAAIVISTVGTALLWWALLKFLPPPASSDPLSIAIGCSGVAALLTLVAGIEAVAHERLVTPAIDPLAGFETKRMVVNQRYLQNTLEQLVVFAAGLLALATYASPRILVILTIVWVISRWVFWIGYHRGPMLRALGASGMAQSMIVLLYAGYRFGSDQYGEAVGLALLGIFAVIEMLLFFSVLKRS